jgi:FdhD protein
LPGMKRVFITRFDSGVPSKTEDLVAAEEALTVFAGGLEVATLLYTPPMTLELTLGYLFSEGMIKSRDDITSLSIKKGSIFVELKGGPPQKGEGSVGKIITSGCGGGVSFIYPQGMQDIKKLRSSRTILQDKVLDLASQFRKISELFEKTGGVHSAALSDGKEFIAFAEDIGRHNAVDKVFGKCLLEGINAEDALLFTTGRVSSEILLKCAKRRIPVIVSRSAPTSLSVRLGEKLGITVIGFARGRRMNVYTHPERVIA